MAYNYFPYGYQPYQMPSQPQAAPQQQNGIIWVQGVEGAKAYPVAAGGSVLLMDSEESNMYIKMADAAGMPTLRVFRYEEITQGNKSNVDMSSYVTRDELEKRLAELTGVKHGESALQPAE